MQELEKAIKNHEADNVATLFGEVQAGARVRVLDQKGSAVEMTVKDDIPYGHKIALAPIAKGQEVTKYGEEIGVATAAIAAGEHVHVHNIDSIRGRGDWAKKGEAR